jgi:hypothetical protein
MGASAWGRKNALRHGKNDPEIPRKRITLLKR